MEPLSTIKAISFDAGGTLFHLRRSVGATYTEIAQLFGIELDVEMVNQAFRDVWTALPNREEATRKNDDRGFWQEIVREVLARSRWTGAEGKFAEFFAKAYSQYAGRAEWALYPESEAVLRKLAARFPLAVTSNYDGRIYRTLEELGIRNFFEAITVSSEVGSDKPSPGIFRATCRALNLPPEQILHIGDERRADYEGARAAGLSSWLLERSTGSLCDLPCLERCDLPE